jgi:hypothetical protein
MLFRTFALLSALPCTAAAWSFANFLQGDWDLERVKGDELIRAHYSLQTTPGGALEGSFFEEDSAGGRSNEMRVKVEFDLAAPDIAGSFSMAKAKVFEDDDEAAAPVPQPAGEVEYGEFKALFEFDFHSRNSDHYWISESKALTGKGGTVQFIASGRNTFIYNQVSTSGSVSTWTATRSGADLAADGRSASTAKRSMLQRWYKWLGALALFLAYRAVKELGGKQKVG